MILRRELVPVEQWEENEQKKGYLKGYITLKRKEKRTLEQIQQLRLDKMFPCVQNDDMPHAHNNSDLSDYIVRLDELMDRLKNERIESINKQVEIRDAILRVENDEEQEVLERHYILGQSWTKICDEMPNYSRRAILYIHGRALKNFKIP
nr:MAG TPA: Protein of unknown function (DUF722) [Caudoviricetes sp.]